jgi:hypothetical protein
MQTKAAVMRRLFRRAVNSKITSVHWQPAKMVQISGLKNAL